MALDVLKRYNTQLSLALCLAISGAYPLLANQANAQITPDTTLPAGERSLLDLGSGEVNGKIVDLIKGGAIRDINLFHSFLEFNVGNGQSVYFANPAGIQNILSRVTGKNPSNIFGTLGVNGGANLFLINPKGILFGKNAKLDVRGSFVGTTADGIGFGNQGVFSASNPEPPSPLLTVNPNVFFFNQIPDNMTRGSITSRAKLEKLAVDNLLLLGGDVEVIEDSKISTNQGGNILLAGLSAAEGQVALTRDGNKLGLDFPNGVKKGNVRVINSAIETLVPENGNVDGGEIRIIADSLEVETSNKDQGISTITQGNGKKGGDIIITTDSSVTVTTNNDGENKPNQGIFTITEESGGEGGKITITSGLISVSTSKETEERSRVEEDQGIFTKTAAVGSDGGEIILTADQLKVSVFSNTDNHEEDTEDQGILTKTTNKAGNGGKITINAGSVFLTSDRSRANIRDQTEEGIFTKTEKRAGDGGDIEINVTGDVLLTNKGTIKTKTTSSGQGGTIEINAPNGNVTLEDRSRIQAWTRGSRSRRRGDQATGNGGETIIHAGGTVAITEDSRIENRVGRADGDSGKIEIIAGELLMDSRRDLQSQSDSGDGRPRSTQTQITTNTNDNGNAGPIVIRVGSLTIIGPNRSGPDGITTSTRTSRGNGNAGDIDIIVEGDFILKDQAQIEAVSQRGATGNGGEITIKAGSLFLSRRSAIDAEARNNSPGNPGNISITVKDKIELTNSDITTAVGRNAGDPERAQNTPGGGNITITARSLSLKDGGRLEAFTQGNIAAGDITVNATDFVDISGIGLDNDDQPTRESGIFTQTRNGAEAGGGLIQIETPSLRLSDGALLNAQSESGFAGGDIKLDVNTLTVNNSQISASTSSSEKGTAGNVEVNAKDSVLLTGNLPDKSKSPAGIFAQATEGGTARNVTIETDELTVEKGARIAVSGVPLTEEGFPETEVDENGDVDQSKLGEAGKLTIEADSLTLDNGQLVAATGKNPTNNEQAATIDIDVPGVIILDNNSLILADATGDDVDGGNITIEGGVLVALPLNNQDKGSDIFANAQDGDGGNINITLQGLFNLNVLEDTNAFIGSDRNIDPSLAFQNNNSEIAALSFSGGQSGTVTRDITNSAQDPEILPTSLVDPSALIVANCPRSGKIAVDELGEFIVTGRGGLPPSPLDPINQQSVLVDWVTLDTEEETIEEATSTPTPEVSYLPMRGKRRTVETPTPPRRKKKIVEAQGWTVGEDGTIILTAEPNNVTPKSNWYSPRSCGSQG
ncbi:MULTISPECIES: filamentous hemagglutinin N-terminal domain-containing protein [unclassified Moorena]|uniref:filamentous hemagglutinin N-terminal domain-containing protein n=1 Tax=unclassified Moorena TaxID=2683338 RepID=UPI0013CD043A|nr:MULTISPECIES: filamentous hemagglutinin N-terminal domain-containing protein [unclassified Moorena]NEO19683.1 filamentous hemagglutinin N-terminal domain-containing protein [Moorena sp. SIO4A5]NEQ59149.1 filamentous hemagglutinin N-terminal domain-containing protein [Moorena sp. SIO4A1]